MFLKIFLFICLAFPVLATDDLPILSDEYIDYLNKQNLSWKAGRNFPEDTPIEFLHGLLGTLDFPQNLAENEKLLTRKHDHIDNSLIPDEFDSRVKWPKCQSIKSIRDQGICGSCWAFATVEPISDRICIASNQTKQVEISAQTLLTCCSDCTDGKDGCLGGYIHAAYQYWIDNGLPTETCQPYTIPPFKHVKDGSRPNFTKVETTPKCEKTCQKSYNKSFESDLYFGSSYSKFQTVEDIQKEIMTNGPVTASFTLHEDFYNYESGVYQSHSNAVKPHGHAVKIIGWGVENHLPYWLAANSWNENWGDKGFFKILRGKNHCGIESSVYGGVPLLN